MDKNKAEVLKSIIYRPAECCDHCIHSNFGAHSQWGICKLFEYSHQKHTESKRPLSINKFGICREFDFKKIKEEFFNY